MSGLRQTGLLLLVIAVVVAAGCHSGTSHDSQEAAAAAPAPVGTEQEPVQSLGDMNEDGVASVTDAIAILRIVVGFDAYTPRADADNSGAAGVADAILVLRAVVGLGAWPIAPPDIFDNQIASAAPDAEAGQVDLPDGSQVNAALTHVILNISGNATSLDGWDLQQHLAQTGSTIAAWEPGLRQIVVETPDVETTEDYLENLPTLAAVDLAMPNIDARPTQASVFDPDPATFDGDYWMDQSRAREAWQVAVDERGAVNSDVILGVVDTGIDATNHFSGTQIETVGATLLGDGTDEVGHGTNVAGLMVSPGDDAVGACGIAWGNRIKVVDWWEQTDGAQFSFDIAQGIRVAIDAGAAVVNVSAGANTYSYDGAGNVTGILPHDACIILQQRFRMNMTPAVRYAMDQGALVVFAAGNDGEVVKDDDGLLPAGAPPGWPTSGEQRDDRRRHHLVRHRGRLLPRGLSGRYRRARHARGHRGRRRPGRRRLRSNRNILRRAHRRRCCRPRLELRPSTHAAGRQGPHRGKRRGDPHRHRRRHRQRAARPASGQRHDHHQLAAALTHRRRARLATATRRARPTAGPPSYHAASETEAKRSCADETITDTLRCIDARHHARGMS